MDKMENFYTNNKIKISEISKALFTDTENFLDGETDNIPTMKIEYMGMIAEIDTGYPEINEYTQEYFRKILEVYKELSEEV